MYLGIQGVDPEQDGWIKTWDPLPGWRHHRGNSLCGQPHGWSVALAWLSRMYSSLGHESAIVEQGCNVHRCTLAFTGNWWKYFRNPNWSQWKCENLCPQFYEWILGVLFCAELKLSGQLVTLKLNFSMSLVLINITSIKSNSFLISCCVSVNMGWRRCLFTLCHFELAQINISRLVANSCLFPRALMGLL